MLKTPAKNKERGFTIIELVIVIIVVIALGVLVIRTFGTIRQKDRDSERQKDLAALRTELDVFYQNHGYYPSRADFNDKKWLSANLKTLNHSYLTDPANPSHSQQLAGKPTAKQYAYVATDSNGNSCEEADTNCTQYALTVTFEGVVNGASSLTKTNLDPN